MPGIFDKLDEEFQRREAEAYAAANAPTVEEKSFATVKEAADFVGTGNKADMKRGEDGTWRVKRTTVPKDVPIPNVDAMAFAKDTAAKLLKAYPDTPDADLIALKEWATRKQAVGKVRAETSAAAGESGLTGSDVFTAPFIAAGEAADRATGRVLSRGMRAAGRALGANVSDQAGVDEVVAASRKESPVLTDAMEGAGATLGALAVVTPAAQALSVPLRAAGLSAGVASTSPLKSSTAMARAFA